MVYLTIDEVICWSIIIGFYLRIIVFLLDILNCDYLNWFAYRFGTTKSASHHRFPCLMILLFRISFLHLTILIKSFIKSYFMITYWLINSAEKIVTQNTQQLEITLLTSYPGSSIILSIIIYHNLPYNFLKLTQYLCKIDCSSIEVKGN